MPNPEAAAESWLEADWPAPPGVRAGISTRRGGDSAPPFDTLNMGLHVGDAAGAVAANRARLRRLLQLPGEPLWLRQQHGNAVLEAPAGAERTADACVARVPGMVCAILVADCIPLLLADASGEEIAAVHVGWRGLCADVAGAAIARLRAPRGRLLAWIGPHICREHYPVGAEVRAACLDAVPGAEAAFTPSGNSWLANLAQLLRCQLGRHGVTRVFGGGLCNFADARRWFSHRRDGQSGRMAALIWRPGALPGLLNRGGAPISIVATPTKPEG